MSSTSFDLSLSAAPRTNWIIGRQDDLTWFIGSAAAGYLALGLLKVGFPFWPLYFIWLVLIDGPHVFATATRTYFDRSERGRRGLLLWLIVPASLLGPAMWAAGQERIFYLFVFSWLHYHIAKQHFGFVMIYKRKNGDHARADFLIDRYCLLVALLFPLLRFIIADYPALARLNFVRGVEKVALVVYVAAGLIFVGRQAQKLVVGGPLNPPKLLLFLAVVPLQWLAFNQAIHSPHGILEAGIAVGLCHSLQYHRLMWFHNRNRYAGPDGATRAGWAATLSRSFIYYFGAAAGLNLICNVIPTLGLSNVGFLQVAVWGPAITHYCLDAKIWRVRGDRELAAALKI